jgi:Conserved TM helix
VILAAVDLQGGIENTWSNVATFLPKLAAALLILVVGYFVAKLISRILDRVLERVGFDRMVERGGLRQALARSKYDPSDILAKIVFWAVMLFVLQLAAGVFGSNPISDLLRGLIAYLPNIFVAILIVVIAAAIAKAATDLLSSLLSGMQGGQLLARGAGTAILVFAAFAALDQLRVAPRIVTGLWYAILAAVVGSVIVAVGGGGIRTMQRYWDRMVGKAEERGPELRQQAQASAAQAQPDQRYGDGRTAEYPSTQGASAADLYDTGSGQVARARRGR